MFYASGHAEAPLAELPLERLEAEIHELAAHITAGSARWLELIGEFDRREGWADTGCRSTSDWVAWRCALDPRSAREHVRVARRLPELPVIRAAFAAGELSYSKVRALTRFAEPDGEADMLELARHATAAQLERIVRAARRVTAAEANENYRESFVSWSWDEHGCLCFTGRLPAEDGATFLRALEASREALYAERRADGGSAEPQLEAGDPAENGSAEPLQPPSPPPVPSAAEALTALSEHAAASVSRVRGSPDSHQVLIHIDIDSLPRDHLADEHSERAVGDGPGLAPETVRRLLCDGSAASLLERDGRPLDVGRRTRAVPASIRRALLARDGRCQYPGCERVRFVEAHHIVHWAHGGPTSLDNLVLLCRYHHRLVHEGGAAVRRRGEESPLEFYAPDGTRIGPLGPCEGGRRRPRSNPSRLREEHGAAGLAVGPDTILSGSGERMDLSLAVDAALQRNRRPPSWG